MPFEFSEKFEKSALKKGESDVLSPETPRLRSADDLRRQKREEPEDMNNLINRRLKGVEDSSKGVIKNGEERFNKIAESTPLEDKSEFEKTKQETRGKLDSNTDEIRNLSTGAKKEIERKRPGGAVPEYSLWEPRIEIGKDGQKKEKGVRAPDGTYYKLEEGERFVINKGEKGDYEAVIIGPGGEEKILRKSLAQEKVEQETTGEAPEQSQRIFDNVYEQLRPKADMTAGKARKNFVESLAQYQDVHIEKIDKNESIDQALKKIWTEGMAKKLARFSSDQKEYQRRNTTYSEMYLKLKKNINQLTQSGEVDPFVAKVFLENFRALKESNYYNDITGGSEKPSNEAKEKYHTAAQDLYSLYGEDKIIEEGGFHHFNRKGNEDVGTKNRVYLSADLTGSPEKLVSAWKNALIETGLQDKIYFKLTGQLGRRYETIIVYQTDDISDEDMGKVMEAFQRLCPEDARAKRDMPSSAPIARGISYAPEPRNLNELFEAMDLKDRGDDKKYFGISYNQMIAGFTQLSFELAYKDFTAPRSEKPNPKDLKESAEKYFKQMIKLAGINPETMVPNSQGGKLPAWAEKMSKESGLIK